MNHSSPNTFKRGQVEQAIVAIERVGGRPDKTIRADVKRLLDADRKPRARQLDWTHERLAFYDGEAPGNGAEIAYTPYHAFALLLGVRLLASGIPHSRTLMLLRRLRPELEPAFRKLARQDPRLLRPDVKTEAALAHLVTDGFLFKDAPAMTYLVVQAGPEAKPILMPDEDGVGFVSGNVCGFAELAQRLVFFSHEKQAAVVLEITNAIHQILDTLPRTTVRKRGRQ